MRKQNSSSPTSRHRSRDPPRIVLFLHELFFFLIFLPSRHYALLCVTGLVVPLCAWRWLFCGFNAHPFGRHEVKRSEADHDCRQPLQCVGKLSPFFGLSFFLSAVLMQESHCELIFLGGKCHLLRFSLDVCCVWKEKTFKRTRRSRGEDSSGIQVSYHRCIDP